MALYHGKGTKVTPATSRTAGVGVICSHCGLTTKVTHVIPTSATTKFRNGIKCKSCLMSTEYFTMRRPQNFTFTCENGLCFGSVAVTPGASSDYCTNCLYRYYYVGTASKTATKATSGSGGGFFNSSAVSSSATSKPKQEELQLDWVDIPTSLADGDCTCPKAVWMGESGCICGAMDRDREELRKKGWVK